MSQTLTCSANTLISPICAGASDFADYPNCVSAVNTMNDVLEVSLEKDNYDMRIYNYSTVELENVVPGLFFRCFCVLTVFCSVAWMGRVLLLQVYDRTIAIAVIIIAIMINTT